MLRKTYFERPFGCTVLTINDDTEDEDNEMFGLIVQQSADDPVDTYLASATFTIKDDDASTPTGGKIAFVSLPNPDTSGNGDIYVMNADGTEWQNLTNDPTYYRSPSWSPDGTEIAYILEQGIVNGDGEVYVMNADGSDKRQLTNTVRNFHPNWSPDGSKIVFSSLRDGNFEIYVMNADGTEQQNITNSPARDSSPTWCPVCQ